MQEHQSSTRRSRVSSLCGFFFHGLGPCFLLSAAFAFLLRVFAPLDYFVINQEEFWFDLYALLPLIAVSFGLCCLLGCLIYTLFYKFAPKAVPFAMILHITVLLFLYIQGNFLTGSLGRLTGEEVDWSAFRLQNLLSLFIFLLLLCVFILLLIKKKEIFPGLIANLSLFFTAFFLLCLLFEILPRAKNRLQAPDRNRLNL